MFFCVGLTHLDINLEPAVGKETNVDDLWDDRDQVGLHWKRNMLWLSVVRPWHFVCSSIVPVSNFDREFPGACRSDGVCASTRENPGD